MQGASPLAFPGLNPGGTGAGAYRALAEVCLRNRQLAAKPIEQPFYWQCRQPRRGGTGGDGTIRRTRRRRLRWSSSPGQVEQMPHGGAGKYAKGGVDRRQRGKTSPRSRALQKNFQKPLTEAAQYDIIAKRCQDSGKGHGGVAQLARATGSYPVGHRFKSGLRYHIGQGSAVPYPSGTALVRGFPPGPLVKRPKTPPFHGGNSSSNLLRVTK